MIEYIIIGTLAFALLKQRKGVSGIGSPRRVFGGNSGYVNYSKSVRAVQAEEEGKRSISNFDREFVDNVNALLDIVGAEHITITKAKDIARDCTPDEWHHTSMYGNRTNYYSPETVAKAAMNEAQQEAYEEYEDQQWEEEKRQREEEYARRAEQQQEEEKYRQQAHERSLLLQKAIAQILAEREEAKAVINQYMIDVLGYKHRLEDCYWINLDNSTIQISLTGQIMSRRYSDEAKKGEAKIKAKMEADQYIQDLLAEANRMVDEELNKQ